MKGEILLAGLDIGTSKTNALIAELRGDYSIDIVGVGSAPSRGIKRGVIIDLEQAADAVSESVSKAERMAGVQIDSAVVAINGSHISSFNSQGVIAISKDHPDITEDDISKVIEAAQAGVIAPDRELIHILPREFILDGQKGILDPLGMAGSRLEGKVHIVTGSSTAIQNLFKCMEITEIEVDELIFGNLACGNAILNKTEKELGVLLIDMGAGSSDVSIFINDNIAYSSILPLGGIQVTNDLAIGLKTTIEEAERLKIKYGNVLENYISPDEVIEVTKGDKLAKEKIPKKLLVDIIEPRIHEIFSIIKEELERSNCLNNITQGVVITGGCALLPGITDLAGKIFKMNVRIGKPDYQGALSDLVNDPRLSTEIGLLDYALKQEAAGSSKRSRKRKGTSVFSKAINWLRDFF